MKHTHSFWTILVAFFMAFGLYSCGGDDEKEPDAPQVEARFSADKTEINEGESVTFTDNSTGDPTTWDWTFDGGNPASSSTQNPVVKYETAGEYNVTLKASNSASNDTETKPTFIKVKSSVVADFSADKTTITAGESITFSDKSTGDPTAWVWTFEGGNPASSTDQNPSSVKYDEEGVYEVILKVTRDNLEDSKTMDIIVQKAPEIVSADFSADKTKVTEGENITFSDKSTGNPTSWEWTFEGGTPNSSTEQNPSIKYETSGTYKVTLMVRNTDSEDTKTQESYITVEKAPEIVEAKFSADKTQITEGETIKFTDESTGNPTSWTWTFEGGTPTNSTEQNPSVKYDKSGTYSVTLVAKNADTENTETKTSLIVVSAPAPTITADFSADNTSIETGGKVVFSDKSSGDTPTAWEWTFEGGLPANSGGQNPTVYYFTSGTYKVTLKVTSANGDNTKIQESYITVGTCDVTSTTQNDVCISVTNDVRTIKSNGLADHEVGTFPNNGNPHTISAQDFNFTVDATPTQNNTVTSLSNNGRPAYRFGVAINGVVFDPVAAEPWAKGTANENYDWVYEPMSEAVKLGEDVNAAHVQPNGTYHYHGVPTNLVASENGSKHSALYGFAADGFPIYYKFVYSDGNNASSNIKGMVSSYRLRSGSRGGDGVATPNGDYNGDFVNDYEYVEGLGDLDECNGRFGITPEYPNGTYYYVITDNYPFIPRCFKGTPDDSFRLGR